MTIEGNVIRNDLPDIANNFYVEFAIVPANQVIKNIIPVMREVFVGDNQAIKI